jgi:hypothetical protein
MKQFKIALLPFIAVLAFMLTAATKIDLFKSFGRSSAYTCRQGIDYTKANVKNLIGTLHGEFFNDDYHALEGEGRFCPGENIY